MAPFWSTNDIRISGSVRYTTLNRQSLSNGENEIELFFEMVNKYIRTTSEDKNFSGSWMLIARWDHVHPYPHGDTYWQYWYYYYYYYYHAINNLVSLHGCVPSITFK